MVGFFFQEQMNDIILRSSWCFWWRQWDFTNSASPWMASHKISPWMMSHDEWCALNDQILLALDSPLIQLLLFFPTTQLLLHQCQYEWESKGKSLSYEKQSLCTCKVISHAQTRCHLLKKWVGFIMWCVQNLDFDCTTVQFLMPQKCHHILLMLQFSKTT
jgi:hypothetical protein